MTDLRKRWCKLGHNWVYLSHGLYSCTLCGAKVTKEELRTDAAKLGVFADEECTEKSITLEVVV